ncbi:class IV adenylate cyclase [Pyrobaculum aerophilum]|uniref:Adenylate cyclase n=2 Tax=Pyrobaculum aerophilum TaxID=13773 RepID=Q8ZYD0_PYRAE|nr:MULTISPECIES: class IV adenylate cyclase [Pyrobaculum]AAL63063.1 adenylate cyclase [Pyrobaculum aerophilum str. IM2]MCX8135563.1 class IV adenylate cyclase [Pyrobaculum aerophilum]HII48169.1 class IV adenylate cyclase [Pyrobaculum aerophilum]
MLEVEVKYRADLSLVKNRLQHLGFSPVSVVYEEDVYFQHPCRDFSATDEALRVRISEGRVTVTYKGPRMGAGAKTRLEVSAQASGEVVELLNRLGFKAVAVIKKRREYYRNGDVLLSLDYVEGLGEFVEIEKMVEEESQIASAIEEIRRLASTLGLAEEVRETYLELYFNTFKSSG